MVEPQQYMMSFGSLVHVGTVFAYQMNQWCQTELGVSLPEYDLLKQVDLHDGRLRMVDLAERLMMTKMGITKMVDRLEEAGLVKRVSSAEDRRVVTAALTDRGSALLTRSHPLFRAWVREHFAELLSDEDIDDLARVTRRLLEALGRWDVQTANLRARRARDEGREISDPADGS